MSSALLFILLLSGLGIGGNIFSDAGPVCLDGWTPFNEHCYLFNETATTWADAEAYCIEFDAHLTSIHGQEQYAFIRRLIRSATGDNTRTWLGGTNAGQGGQWMWVDGSAFDFTSWSPGEPNNSGGNEHCMDMNVRGQNYINDENCDTQSAFLCAKK